MLCELKTPREIIRDMRSRIEVLQQEKTEARLAYERKLREIEREEERLVAECNRLEAGLWERERQRHKVKEINRPED